ncbi:type II toxin-antitoxin system RelE/ParE family toxin [Gemmatimonas sp.]|uniref:type II toxin-antitoxin system RelE/ParE family toxin n=1 Tax=Gemmatimonas sp. TaxID=1962908 RepID=UPI003DA5C759
MIRTFRDRRTRTLFLERVHSRVRADIGRRAVQKLDLINEAGRLDDLRFPPGNRLHQLRGDRDGQWSISVNDQWRICFRWSEGDAFDVEFCDYH